MRTRPRELQPELPSQEASESLPSWADVEGCIARGAWPVAGVDESGRGPLAGPVVAAAVILSPEGDWAGLTDSKLLLAAQREDLAVRIRAAAIAVGVGLASVDEIDAINILRATHLAMARSLAELSPSPAWALVDGLPVTGLPCPHQALVAGDQRCFAIAAASVIAKVFRDDLMRELDREHPGYGFAEHKGYHTPRHLVALAERGPSPIHRRSFSPVKEMVAPERPGTLDP